ncbi:MAG: putative glycoside hydrolase [Deltaproteobacteria bacterium]|nr:putative glycoside hydrolase [Deltaproteobacteria bacterium]
MQETGLFDVQSHSYGHTRERIAVSRLSEESQVLELEPVTPKALYLSFFGIGNTALRLSALNLIEATELNALVIDVKGDRGMIAYKSAIPLATPDLAVKTGNGRSWHDREHLAWADPFKKEVQNYNIEVAVEAAESGFDEIQFDYVRFPDARGLVFSMPSTEQNRVNAISAFLQEARKRLASYNVFLAADIFGYVCWNLDDTEVGQRLEELMLHLDYISPMLYPSCFQYGIPGYRNPVAHPYEIVYHSLKRAKERTGLPSARFRPWLQAFKDYAFDRRPFSGKEIRAQIKAAEDFGADGWMLWNSRNIYSKDGLYSEDGLRQ